MKASPTTLKSISHGNKIRLEILRVSTDIASAEGLEGLTIGRLAKDAGMSKSGLFAHFGSKEDLQLATLEAAALTFAEQIIEPTANVEPGVKRLVAMLEAWIQSVEKSNYRGGCLFFSASAEMDDRPGKVRDLLAELTESWVIALNNEAKLAVRLGELREDCNVELLIFQIHGFVQEANWFYRLHNEKRAFDWARKSIDQILRFLRTGGEKI